MTRIDEAHARMEADGHDAARLAWYGTIADSEVMLLVQEGDNLSPRIFDLSEGPVVLAFDSEDRLAVFTGEVSAFAALPGREAIAALAGRGIGLGLNLGAPSGALLPPDVVDWLADVLAQRPVAAEALPEGFEAPKALPEALLHTLDSRLARAGGIAAAALLAQAVYRGGRRAHLLAFLDAAPGAEDALARAVGEALTFSGLDAGEMDVTFLAADDPAAIAMARVALRFDLAPAPPAAPGSNPDRPPILRRPEILSE